MTRTTEEARRLARWTGMAPAQCQTWLDGADGGVLRELLREMLAVQAALPPQEHPKGYVEVETTLADWLTELPDSDTFLVPGLTYHVHWQAGNLELPAMPILVTDEGRWAWRTVAHHLAIYQWEARLRARKTPPEQVIEMLPNFTMRLVENAAGRERVRGYYQCLAQL